MIHFLVRTFVRNHEDISNHKVREQYGILSSMVGVVINILLFITKFTIGSLTHSIAITSDAFNNLSDFASSIITMFGYKMASKPADQDHPFGHGRMEYLISLVVASMILLVGFEFLQTSIEKIRNPQQVIYSTVALISLLCSILLKAWLFMFNSKLGKRINSSVMKATAKDSLSDVVITTLTAIALILAKYTTLAIDGWAGILVSVFIMNAGFQIIKETVDTLLGQSADQETIQSIRDVLQSSAIVMDVHDVIVHNYGPGRLMASAHVEVEARGEMLAYHQEIDKLERAIRDSLNINIVLHMDPIDTSTDRFYEMKAHVQEVLQDIHADMNAHDFRVFMHTGDIILEFDVDVPFDLKQSDEQLKQTIDERLASAGCVVRTQITFDRTIL